VSSTAAAITAWVEFSDLGQKVERYSAAIRSIKNLLSWWNSLSEVEKVATLNINRLVVSGGCFLAGGPIDA
jgi:hypothetical protein